MVDWNVCPKCGAHMRREMEGYLCEKCNYYEQIVFPIKPKDVMSGRHAKTKTAKKEGCR
jgi:tRNA(Ile2) C34 agmatinyltransferase TiaS